MAQIYNEELTSGFVKPDDILKTDRFTDFSAVSSKGYSLLVRAKRHGRWWLLKGLKEQYRQDAVYQVLLQRFLVSPYQTILQNYSKFCKCCQSAKIFTINY